jgi:CopG family nickel-responsive transcriptional regulator
MAVERIGVSLEKGILDALDRYVKKNKFPNRSRAIRSLVEKGIVEEKWNSDDIVAGAVILLYDHHKRDLTKKLNQVQHDYFDSVLSTMHFHLNHDNCLEIIALQGTAKRLKELSDLLIGVKGIIHGKLVMSRTV